MKESGVITIDAYIASFPREVRIMLESMRQTITAAAKGGEETIKYGIPTITLEGSNLVHFAAYKHHIGFYPTPSGIQAFAKEFSKYKTSKGAVQLPLDEALPLTLITKVVKMRVRETIALAKKQVVVKNRPKKLKTSTNLPDFKRHSMKASTAHDERFEAMTFALVYPMYVAKVEKKGRTQEELGQVITWLTGFTKKELQNLIKEKVTFKTFFERATLHPHAHLITGTICGYRIEEIKNPLTKKVRYLDKIVDELAKGRPLEKILRK